MVFGIAFYQSNHSTAKPQRWEVVDKMSTGPSCTVQYTEVATTWSSARNMFFLIICTILMLRKYHYIKITKKTINRQNLK